MSVSRPRSEPARAVRRNLTSGASRLMVALLMLILVGGGPLVRFARGRPS